MKVWKQLPPTFPADGALVWCRRYWLDKPFQATYDATADTFTTNAGHVLPWYMVATWRVL